MLTKPWFLAFCFDHCGRLAVEDLFCRTLKLILTIFLFVRIFCQLKKEQNKITKILERLKKDKEYPSYETINIDSCFLITANKFHEVYTLFCHATLSFSFFGRCSVIFTITLTWRKIFK